MLRFLAFFTLFFGALPAWADSFLGLGAAEAQINWQAGDDVAPALGSGTLALVYQITPHHSFQIDGSIDGTPESWRGVLAGHLSLSPQSDRKYGLFVRYSDANNAAAWAFDLGAELLYEPLPGLTAELRAGVGLTRPGDLDYIFAGLNLNAQLTDAFAVEFGYDVQQFDEAGFQAIGQQARLGLALNPARGPVTVVLGVQSDWLTGDGASTINGAFVETRIALRMRGSTTTRPFALRDPLAGLRRRGLAP